VIERMGCEGERERKKEVMITNGVMMATPPK
jgi:hypothetical protein